MGLGPPAALWDLRLPVVKVCDFLCLAGLFRAVRKKGAICDENAFGKVNFSRLLKRSSGVLSLLDGGECSTGTYARQIRGACIVKADRKVDLVVLQQLLSGVGTVWWWELVTER